MYTCTHVLLVIPWGPGLAVCKRESAPHALIAKFIYGSERVSEPCVSRRVGARLGARLVSYCVRCDMRVKNVRSDLT